MGPGRFDLEALLRDLAGEFAEAAQRTGVSIAVDVPQVLPGLWDRVALEQIIDNLISNSLKYVLEHRSNCGHVGEELVRIEVRDHGPGIAATKLSSWPSIC